MNVDATGLFFRDPILFRCQELKSVNMHQDAHFTAVFRILRPTELIYCSLKAVFDKKR